VHIPKGFYISSPLAFYEVSQEILITLNSCIIHAADRKILHPLEQSCGNAFLFPCVKMLQRTGKPQQHLRRWSKLWNNEFTGDVKRHGGLYLKFYKYVIIYFSNTPRQLNG